MTPATPRDAALAMESHARLPAPPGERFAGYGVLAQPFASGHVLAFRRAAASSVGPRFTSVWHRDPQGLWTCWLDVQPDHGCPRYYGPAFHRAVHAEIDLTWDDDDRVALSVPAARLEWSLRLETTPATRLVSAGFRLAPRSLLDHQPALRSAGRLAGRILDAEPFDLIGTSPAGHGISLTLDRVWIVGASMAVVDARDAGPIGGNGAPPVIGDAALPGRGLFVVGRTRYVAGNAVGRGEGQGHEPEWG